MAQQSGTRHTLALLLALLGVGACFLTWDRTSFLGITDEDDGWERREGVAATALFSGTLLCLLLSRRRHASRWWHALGYFLLPLTTIGLMCWFAWGYVPAGLRARLGSGTRLGAAFGDFGSAFKWSSIGMGAYAALALAVAILLLGLTRTSKGRNAS